MRNPFRSLLELRQRVIAEKEAREDWEERVVEPILASGHDKLLTEAYRHRTRAVLLSLLIGGFVVVAMLSYVMWDISWLTRPAFYMVLGVCAFGVFWTLRETMHHVRSHLEKMRQWLDQNDTFYRR